MAVFTVSPTLQSFGEVVAQEFERPESRALPTFVSAEVGNATPKTAFRSLEPAVPTLSGIAPAMQADVQTTLPPFLERVELRNLTIDTARLDLVLDRHQKEVALMVASRTGEVEVILVV